MWNTDCQKRGDIGVRVSGWAGGDMKLRIRSVGWQFSVKSCNIQTNAYHITDIA